MIRKYKKICKHCKSENIVFDAWSKWDRYKQEYVLANTFDYCFCIDCDGETKYIEVELKEEVEDDKS